MTVSQFFRYPANRIGDWYCVFNETIQRNKGPFVVLIIGIALHIFRYYSISYSLISCSLGFFLGREITDIEKQYKNPFLNQGAGQLRRLIAQSRKLRGIFLIFSLIAYPKTPYLSMTSAALVGLSTASSGDEIEIPKELERTTYF